MIRRTYFGSIVLLIVLIGILNFYAYQSHWYWEFWWFDMIMHTLGGIWVASCALWFYYFRKTASDKLLQIPQKSSVFFIAIASIFVIGVGWELFEFNLDKFITFSIHDSIDTASDLFFDFLGSILAVFLFFSVYNGSK